MNKSKTSEKEIDTLGRKLDEFENDVKNLTLDRMNQAPVQDIEPQTKLSSKEMEKSKQIYLKPERAISCVDKFNEVYREDWNFAKEYVQFIAEHKEILGETIEMWTKPFAGIPAEFWKIPTNKPVFAPRYVAEQIRKCNYHRLRMEENRVTGSDGVGTYYGTMVSDTTVQRLTAEPVLSKKSLFMGAA